MLDLRTTSDKECFLGLVRAADVLIESFAPGTTAVLGIAYETLIAHNPRLIYCTITGYGSTGRLADRPGIDSLVAARTGQLWEARGTPGGTLAKLARVQGHLAGVQPPAGLMVGADRPGPLFSALPWVSLGALYLASIGITAALRVRELTGRGQCVQTSLLQGRAGDDCLFVATG